IDDCLAADDGRWTMDDGSKTSAIPTLSSIVHRPSSIVQRPSSIVHRPSSIVRKPANNMRQYIIRPPQPTDLDALVGFEIDIARISFPDDPVVDPEVHRKKLSKALERDREGMFVAEEVSTGEVVGWLWVLLHAY